MPLPGNDAGVNVEVEVDVDVEPLSEGVSEEWGDGAEQVCEGGSSRRDAFVGHLCLEGSFMAPGGGP
eukprot:7816318-Heterocapsa_arctica.AAC.1